MEDEIKDAEVVEEGSAEIVEEAPLEGETVEVPAEEPKVVEEVLPEEEIKQDEVQSE